MTAPNAHPPGGGTPTSNGVDPATANRDSTSAGVDDEAKAADAADSTSGASPDAAGDSRQNGAKGSPLDGIEDQFSELLAYLAYYVTARWDLVQWRLGALVWRLVLLLGVGLAMLSVMVTAAVFVMRGLAHGLGTALGDRMWAGELIVGVVFFVVMAISQSVAFRRVRARWRKRILAKYEYYRERQRAAFGHDVEGAAERQVD